MFIYEKSLMFYGDTTQSTRQMFFVSWQKHLNKQPVTPLEQQIIEVILEHPEYNSLFENTLISRDNAYYPELGQTNPFLHMGLHLAIRDQVTTNRPVGITKIFKQLLKKHKDSTKVEHCLMECLAEALWSAQRNQRDIDENAYLLCALKTVN